VKYIKTIKLSDVFIITPFRNQEEVLNHYLLAAKENGEIESSINCEQFIKFREKNNTIIISTSISIIQRPEHMIG
jgi:hypothetical protein